MLLIVITGPVHARDDVTLPVVMAERLEAIQPGVLPEFQALGLAFTAGLADDGSTWTRGRDERLPNRRDHRRPLGAMRSWVAAAVPQGAGGPTRSTQPARMRRGRRP